jgi:hypothetical protein
MACGFESRRDYGVATRGLNLKAEGPGRWRVCRCTVRQPWLPPLHTEDTMTRKHFIAIAKALKVRS